MRHLTRLYFYNSETSDKYVAMIDQGTSGSGHPRFNHQVGFMRTAAELLQANHFMLRGAAFFKLPVGATAIVDVHVPDEFGSNAPKTFDYQVFKSQATPPSEEVLSEQLGQFLSMVGEIVSDKFPTAESNEDEPAGPNEQDGPGGATGTCSLYGPSACCGGQTEIPCDDPLNSVAECLDDQLVCVVPEPPADRKSK